MRREPYSYFELLVRIANTLTVRCLGPAKYFGLILTVNYFKTKRPTSYTFSISFFNSLSNWTQSWLLLLLFSHFLGGVFCVVPLPQIASFEPKDVYGQRVLQLGTPEESVPGQNKVYLPRRLCSSALRLVLTLKFGNLSQALYHAGSCLESAFVTPWNYFSLSSKTARIFSNFPSYNDLCQPVEPLSPTRFQLVDITTTSLTPFSRTYLTCTSNSKGFSLNTRAPIPKKRLWETGMPQT